MAVISNEEKKDIMLFEHNLKMEREKQRHENTMLEIEALKDTNVTAFHQR